MIKLLCLWLTKNTRRKKKNKIISAVGVKEDFKSRNEA